MKWIQTDNGLTCGPWTVKNTRPLTPQALDLFWNDQLVDWDFHGNVDSLKRAADHLERFAEILQVAS